METTTTPTLPERVTQDRPTAPESTPFACRSCSDTGFVGVAWCPQCGGTSRQYHQYR